MPTPSTSGFWPRNRLPTSLFFSLLLLGASATSGHTKMESGIFLASEGWFVPVTTQPR